jgi:trehalose synthase
MMYRLGKIGFSQSYTYFTWRESKREFIDYLTELTQTRSRDFFRPNFFVNTPDINPRFLQTSGRAGFVIRAALAATLSGLWGVYSGFELCEAAALPNSEEYLDSRSIRLRAWDWNRPGNIVGEITALNRIAARIRRCIRTSASLPTAHNDQHPVLRESHAATRQRDAGRDQSRSVHEQGADVELPWPRWEFGPAGHDALAVEDLMTGARFAGYGKNAACASTRTSAVRDLAHRADGGHCRERQRPSDSHERHLTVIITTALADVAQNNRSGTRTRSSISCTSKSFFDSNNDGIGDFPGLIQQARLHRRTSASHDLAAAVLSRRRCATTATTSPTTATSSRLRHDGRLPRFIQEAHARGMRVITELVINHTSDQHPWFQRARRRRRDRPKRDFYVWSDTDQKYAGTRIIFSTPKSRTGPGTRSPRQYYWHRFFSHQPDLNFDNPRGARPSSKVMRFWLDMGVDGFRLDAMPYLVEREGTNNENLPETHAVLKKIRAEIDANYRDRMLLAEANQWPEDVQRLFRRRRRMPHGLPLPADAAHLHGDRAGRPLPDHRHHAADAGHPANCQWAIFLRNHDELTLEMVTDASATTCTPTPSRSARAHQSRHPPPLAPLMDNDRRRIELMNSAAAVHAGHAVIYYGDEIGMGDNIYLGDRDGVRTPMQWTPDRNGGFSRADPAAAVLPPSWTPLYGYEAVNVEAQSRRSVSSPIC